MSIHFIMQGKGGVGKSMVASILIQYFLNQGFEIIGCDTDPVNSSLTKYKSLDVKIIDIMNGGDIESGRIDRLINRITESPPDSRVVVDIGASCFIPVCSYLKQHGAFELIQDLGFTSYIHTIITGGANLLDTLNNFSALMRHFDVPTVVWLNPFFGKIKIGDNTFENSKIYNEVAESLHGVIEMPNLSPLFLQDFMDMQTKHQTFKDAVQDSQVSLMVRQRMKTLWEQYQKVIDGVELT